MEFPKHPSRRQMRHQQDVSTVIKGMQDVLLEVDEVRMEEIIRLGEMAVDYGSRDLE